MLLVPYLNCSVCTLITVRSRDCVMVTAGLARSRATCPHYYK